MPNFFEKLKNGWTQGVKKQKEEWGKKWNAIKSFRCTKENILKIVKNIWKTMFVNEFKEEDSNESDSQKKYYVKYSLLYVILFSLYRACFQLCMSFIQNIMMPNDVVVFVGTDSKSTYLGVLLGLLSGVYLLGPFIGMLCDMTKISFIGKLEIGKRKPWVFLATVIYLLTLMSRSLFVFANVPCFLVYIFLSVFGAFSGCVANVGFTALFPDLFHKSQYNIVSGALGFSNLVGQTAAIGIFGMLWNDFHYYFLVTCVVVVGFLSVLPILLFKESRALNYVGDKKLAKIELDKEKENTPSTGDLSSKPKKPKEKLTFKKFVMSILSFVWKYISPFLKWNFFFTFFSRFFFMFSFASISSFFLYFLKDMVESDDGFYYFFGATVAKSGESAIAISQYVQFGFGVVFSFVGPFASKYLTRKWTVFLCGCSELIALLGFILTREFTFIVFFSAFWGGGSSALNSVFFALITEVLPSKEEAAKDLALFQLANIIPYMLASPIMGVIIEWGNELSANGEMLGYWVLFIVACICTTIGSILVLFLRKKPAAPIKEKELIDDQVFDNPESLKDDFDNEENFDKINVILEKQTRDLLADDNEE